MHARDEESRYVIARDAAVSAPPGEFVSADLADDTARFLEELRIRTGRAKGNGASSEK